MVAGSHYVGTGGKSGALEGTAVVNNDCPDMCRIRKVPQKRYRPELVEG